MRFSFYMRKRWGTHAHNNMHAFETEKDDCNLKDLGFVGDCFTCHDRGLVNNSWSMLFPHAALENLQYNHSDHRPLLVETEYLSASQQAGSEVKVKRFEARWF